MIGAKFKRVLLLLAERVAWLLIFAGVIKTLDDIYLLTEAVIVDPKDPEGFYAWLFDPSPIALLRDITFTAICFYVHRRLVLKRQAEYRAHVGIS